MEKHYSFTLYRVFNKKLISLNQFWNLMCENFWTSPYRTRIESESKWSIIVHMLIHNWIIGFESILNWITWQHILTLVILFITIKTVMTTVTRRWLIAYLSSFTSFNIGIIYSNNILCLKLVIIKLFNIERRWMALFQINGCCYFINWNH